jgi:hypothetical protein
MPITRDLGTRPAFRWDRMTTMLDWISLGAGLLLGILAVLAVVLTILGLAGQGVGLF